MTPLGTAAVDRQSGRDDAVENTVMVIPVGMNVTGFAPNPPGMATVQVPHLGRDDDLGPGIEMTKATDRLASLKRMSAAVERRKVPPPAGTSALRRLRRAYPGPVDATTGEVGAGPSPPAFIDDGRPAFGQHEGGPGESVPEVPAIGHRAIPGSAPVVRRVRVVKTERGGFRRAGDDPPSKVLDTAGFPAKDRTDLLNSPGDTDPLLLKEIVDEWAFELPELAGAGVRGASRSVTAALLENAGRIVALREMVAKFEQMKEAIRSTKDDKDKELRKKQLGALGKEMQEFGWSLVGDIYAGVAGEGDMAYLMRLFLTGALPANPAFVGRVWSETEPIIQQLIAIMSTGAVTWESQPGAQPEWIDDETIQRQFAFLELSAPPALVKALLPLLSHNKSVVVIQEGTSAKVPLKRLLSHNKKALENRGGRVCGAMVRCQA